MPTERQQAVLVTGSSGFIGSRLCERLIVGGYQVVGFDRPGAPTPCSGVDAIPVDMTSDEQVFRALDLVRDRYRSPIISIVHLAAYFDFSGEANALYDRLTIGGTRSLLVGLRKLGLGTEQFIFSSTMLVHAPCKPGEFIDEKWPLDPRWPYPESKVATERLIHEEHGSIQTVILRISGVYDDLCHSIPLANQIDRIYRRSVTSKVFPGHAAHGQSFLHVDDLSDAILRAIARRDTLPLETTLLIGESEPLTYDELQHQLGRLIHGEEWNTVEIPKAVAKTGAWMQDMTPLVDDPFIKPWMIDFADDHYALNIDQAEHLLDWTPRHSLRDTLPKMVAALKHNPAVWYRAHKLTPPAGVTYAAR